MHITIFLLLLFVGSGTPRVILGNNGIEKLVEALRKFEKEGVAQVVESVLKSVAKMKKEILLNI